MSRNQAGTHSPYFGVEIEIFVRLLPDVEAAMLQQRYEHGRGAMLPHWRNWDESLPNNSTDLVAKQAQRECVGAAIKHKIDAALGPDNGWKCESDASLKEYKLTAPNDVRRWWGIEIISPPMNSSKRWQTEIKTIFDEVGQTFDFWTNENCACHVHVSPGPYKDSEYTLNQLAQIAKGTFYWEDALCDFLPSDRRQNRYADPNAKHFATDAYVGVRRNGWRPVFDEIDDAVAQGKKRFIYHMTGGSTFTRYHSTNFDPLRKYGTVELRRQAGAASGLTVIHRVLLALTLHVSWLNVDYAACANRKSHPSGDELFAELSQCIKMLPETCLGARFQNWLNYCQETYDYDNHISETMLNKEERRLREGGDVRTVRRNGGGSGGGGRAGSRQSQVTLPERPRARPPVASSAGRDSPTAPRPLARQGTRVSRDESTTSRPLARRTPAAQNASRQPAAPAPRPRAPPRASRDESTTSRPLVRHVPAPREVSRPPPRRRDTQRAPAPVIYADGAAAYDYSEDDEWYR